MKSLYKFDKYLMNFKIRKNLKGIKRFFVEFWFFGIKQARACLFAGSFFIAMFLLPRESFFGIYRYDLLLIIALLIQFCMIISKLESIDELKAICLFHFLGFCLEAFKTSVVNSWSYPDFAYTKIFGVPLFSRFYVCSSWKLYHSSLATF